MHRAPSQPAFVLTRQGGAASPGRAGMLYRDLIPGCLGGRVIASHISIPVGGPVPDWVHFHEIRFQMIFCLTGWARLVYEDQGEPFLFTAGDCVLQPPLIRHRVLESSDAFAVVEVASPARHETRADPDMALPNHRTAPGRDFSGQAFLRSLAAEAVWTGDAASGFTRRDIGLSAASGGLVSAEVVRAGPGRRRLFPPDKEGLRLGFVLAGAAVLERQGAHEVSGDDAWVIPPGEAWALGDASDDFEMLLVAAPLADEIGGGEQTEPGDADDPG